jgi:hypothetical protein
MIRDVFLTTIFAPITVNARRDEEIQMQCRRGGGKPYQAPKVFPPPLPHPPHSLSFSPQPSQDTPACPTSPVNTGIGASAGLGALALARVALVRAAARLCRIARRRSDMRGCEGRLRGRERGWRRVRGEAGEKPWGLMGCLPPPPALHSHLVARRIVLGLQMRSLVSKPHQRNG